MQQVQGEEEGGGGGLGPQQTVDSVQLMLRQDQSMDLLLTAGTRHHDPTHQHRVALLLLLRLHKQGRRERGEVGRDPSARLLMDDVLRYFVLQSAQCVTEGL